MNARLDARLARAINIADLRRIAQQRLPKAVFEFIDGGAGDEVTLRENLDAFDRTMLRPRILNDVSQPDMRTPWPGQTAQAPIVIAPMGSCMLAWPQADIAIARAAASLGLPYTLSTMSTTSIEAMADAVQGFGITPRVAMILGSGLGVQNPMTCSTPARLYQLRSKITISPPAGKCAI